MMLNPQSNESDDFKNQIIPVSMHIVSDLTITDLRKIIKLCNRANNRIGLSQDAAVLEMVNRDGESDFALSLFNKTTSPALSTLVRGLLDNVDRQRSSYAAQCWLNYGMVRGTSADQVMARGLYCQQSMVKLMYLRVFHVILIGSHHNINPRLKRNVLVYNHVLCSQIKLQYPLSTSCDMMDVPSCHRKLAGSNEPLRLVLQRILHDLMEISSKWFSPHQLLTVLFMPGTGAFIQLGNSNKKNAKMPKCHCLASVLSSNAVYSLNVARDSRLQNLASMIVSSQGFMGTSTFIDRNHPHFCAHCGVFETKKNKLKTCRLCKSQELQSHFMFCSINCQIMSWPYHKWLHRAHKVNH